MTKATPKKKTTTTKKKTTVKAHRGFAHVPLRGRRRLPIQRRPVGDPPRRRPPIQQPTGRRMTPAQRDALMRQRQLAQQRRRRQLTPAQRDRMRKQLEDAAKKQLDRPTLPIRRRPTVEQLRNARRRRRPVGDPKPRRRVTQATQAPRTRPKPRRVI